MYLAPLNYDRYFKKVFSDTRIAKRFLEDFFDFTIDEMEVLPTRHKITDNATAVEFDFRCKVNNNYIIIDMQQWFKTDIVKRFYMYHSMNTVLQLEGMPDKSIDLDGNKKRDIKDYNNLIPVITLIWLADDNLNFTDDFVSYTMTSETVNDFIKNKNIWKEENILELLAQREKCFETITNRTKKLDFLQQNKLIYAFQPNIVKNKKYSKYLPWFELAHKTKNKLNEKGWFDEYLKDDVFVEIIKRIKTESFKQADWEYIKDFEKFSEQVKRFQKAFIEEGIEQGIEQGIDVGVNQEKLTSAVNGIKAGFDNKTIKTMTGLSDEQINKLRKDQEVKG
ncbi:MAG: hypothetical protein K9H64_02370 [Bacteroidales bacterium]|nr:hypothetical protein [Bacteroidales bacterium]MCF8454917.1 hypothetical protein [Bacteroidales bacterium]